MAGRLCRGEGGSLGVRCLEGRGGAQAVTAEEQERRSIDAAMEARLVSRFC